MVVLYDHEVPVVQPAVPRNDANIREATISTNGENALGGSNAAKGAKLARHSGRPIVDFTHALDPSTSSQDADADLRL
jgi:hypothetical protein